jgi:hypothetical protein
MNTHVLGYPFPMSSSFTERWKSDLEHESEGKLESTSVGEECQGAGEDGD